ncbi:hypothetical protein NDU88_005573 [Pleurodeles waltl]|uniref:Uncharacterized protein n=1 Tax=Pleurodeles waltl TaxID=8319 RepID=A0AAV7L164_PLEWA|nr:hypothetical protein NDU88_005573 [Pleurodeles waltl]
MESRFSNPCDDHDGIGNPSGRIPDSLSGRHDNEDATSLTGNPDIRVPEGLKSEDGLHGGGAFVGEDAEGDERTEKRRNWEAERRPATEELKTSSVKDTAANAEVPDGRELRHVPGGTWLNQSTWKSHGEYLRLSRGVLGKKKTAQG